MTMILAVAAVAAAVFLVAFIWREIGNVRDEFFQKARSRSLQRMGIAATVVCLLASAAIVAQAVMLQRQAQGQSASQAEIAQLKLDIARLQRPSVRAAITRQAAPPPEEVPQVMAEAPKAAAPVAKRPPHAYIAANSAVVRVNPGQDRLFTLQRGTEVMLLGDAREFDGRAWQEITIGDGRQGWIAASLLEPAT